MSKRPNIVLTIADDQRWDTLAALGNQHIHTPTLDRLAERGTCYTRAQHGGSTHGAVCAPSRAQLHTGRSLFNISDCLHATTQPVDIRRRPDETAPLATLGSILRDGGYETFGVGKWHNLEPSFVRSFNGGANIFFGGMCPHFMVGVKNLPAGSGRLVGGGIPTGHSTELFSQAAVEFLRTRSRDDEQPFFLYVAFTAPHDPRETHYRFRKLYREHPPLPGNFLPDHPFRLEDPLGRDEALAEFPRDPEEIRMHMADYYAMITHLDEGIGRIHDALAQAGLADNTIVVHTADHGLSIGQHGLMGKQSLYDHSTRVPLMVAGPGFERGAVDDRLCYQHDLHPTLLDAAELENPACDFQHLQSPQRRQTIGCIYGPTMRSIRDERFKLIEYSVFDGRHTQLFDTQADRWETRDLSADPAYAQDLQRLRKALRQYLQQMGDPLAEQFVG